MPRDLREGQTFIELENEEPSWFRLQEISKRDRWRDLSHEIGESKDALYFLL